MNYQTPLARARGLGAAREGSRGWWRQRVTAIALIPLGLWFAVSAALLPGTDYAAFVRWLTSPWNSILLISMMIASFYHAMLGMQVVIEDYVHSDWLKLISILAMKLVLAFLALTAFFALLRIVFSG
jgi:succinate dehydrogenase / fumarate reductase membrane anchor subunit